MVSDVACELDQDCITCGDVAAPLTVVTVDGSDAHCADESGVIEVVAVDLVGAVVPGDRLLVHAKVAIARLEQPA